MDRVGVTFRSEEPVAWHPDLKRRSSMLFSICVPTRNRPDLLREAISSALAQDYPDFEVVVVDNASDADTARAVGQFGRRIRYYRHSQLLSMPDNWNSCLRLARGDFVTILHDDDRLLPHALTRVAQTIREYPTVGFSYAQVRVMGGDGTASNVLLPRGGPIGRLTRDEYLRAICRDYFYRSPGVFVRSDIARKLGGFVGWLPTHTDYEFYVRVGLHTDIFGFDEPLALYRRHPANLTRSARSSGQSTREFLTWKERLLRGYSDLQPDNRTLLVQTLWRSVGYSFREAGRLASVSEVMSLAEEARRMIDSRCPAVLRAELYMLGRFENTALMPLRAKWFLDHLFGMYGKAVHALGTGSWRLALQELEYQLSEAVSQ